MLLRPLAAGDGLTNSCDLRCRPGTRATVVSVEWLPDGAFMRAARVIADTDTAPRVRLSILACSGWVLEHDQEEHPVLQTWREK